MFDLLPLAEAADKVADLDPSLTTGESLMASVLELETAIRALEAARSSWLGELDRLGTTDEVTGHRTATWFAAESNCARGTARRAVRAAGRSGKRRRRPPPYRRGRAGEGAARL